jgi:hypothetical protein
MAQDQSRVKRDQPAGMRAGDDAPPVIMATYKKTAHPDTCSNDPDTDEFLPLRPTGRPEGAA